MAFVQILYLTNREGDVIHSDKDKRQSQTQFTTVSIAITVNKL